MSDELSVLVTAVGGNLGQAVLKALRMSAPGWGLHGVDCDPLGVGQFFCDTFAIVPPASHDDYLTTIDDLAGSVGAGAVIPSSEIEIATLAAANSRLPKSGAVVVSQPADVLAVLADKLTCMRALEGRVAIAPFADGQDWQAVNALVASAGWPVVVKERRASGSRGVLTVHSSRELERAVSQASAPIVQAFIDDEGGEYSACTFIDGGLTDAIVFRRSLGSFGCSMYAETVTDDAVRDYCLATAQSVNASGSLNIQVRKSSGSVRLLEINPRFSSLAAARTAAGFPDVRWSVEMAIGIPLSRPPRRRNLRFRRYFSEILEVESEPSEPSAWRPRF